MQDILKKDSNYSPFPDACGLQWRRDSDRKPGCSGAS